MILTATIEAVTPATPRANLVRVAIDQPFEFMAAQAALVGQHGQPDRRPYSIAMGPAESAREQRLEFLMGLGADGVPGPHLPDLADGAQLDIEGPVGGFT